jgi:hypothetical protein
MMASELDALDPNDSTVDWYLEGILPWTPQLKGKTQHTINTFIL